MDRHIYNQSQQPWTIQVTYNNGNDGNVYFSGDGSGTSENGPWVVPAQGTTGTQFTTTGGQSAGTFVITDHTGSAQPYDFDNGYITHPGATGSVLLNDPAGCDMTITGDQW
jgi:hypothetical protein